MERDFERRSGEDEIPVGPRPFEPTREYPVDRARDEEDLERTVELREERLVPRREMVETGEIEIRKEIEEVPGRLEIDAYREDVEIEHVPVGQAVNERVAPWEEDGALVVPVYEEQLVVSKRLVMKEKLFVRRVAVTEKRLFTDTLRREKLVVDDPNNTGVVHDRMPATGEPARETQDPERPEEGGILHNIVRRALS